MLKMHKIGMNTTSYNFKLSFCITRRKNMRADKTTSKSYSNGEMIRHMSDEELAHYFSSWQCRPDYSLSGEECLETDCTSCWLSWLKQDASEMKTGMTCNYFIEEEGEANI